MSGAGLRAGSALAIGVDVGAGEGVGLGLGGRVRVALGRGLAIGVADSEATVGACATGEAGAGPQQASPQVIESDTRNSTTAERRMRALPFQHDIEEIAKDTPCQIIPLLVPGGDDLLSIPATLREPGTGAHQSFGDLGVVLRVELNTPHRPVSQAIGLHPADLAGRQQLEFLW